MVCYHPITCVYPLVEDSDGKRRLLFSEKDVKSKGFQYFDHKKGYIKPYDGEFLGYKIQVPCGRCIGCRLDYSRQWATRAIHEAMSHTDNTFVTLTFNDDHLPLDNSVHKSYLSSWLKRFRKRFGEDIRFMACGEYGEKFQRPHYHLLLFNFKFPDQKYWSSRHKQIYYRSEMLENLWREPYSSESNGFSVIGDVSFESAAYVARYVTKKFKGCEADVKKFYGDREPEFLSVSRMPGLGFDFIKKHYKQIFDNGYIVLPNKHKAPIPRYYMDKLKEFDLDLYNSFSLDKRDYMIDNLFKEDINSTQQRLLAREELQNQKLDNLVRCYEFDANLHNIY